MSAVSLSRNPVSSNTSRISLVRDDWALLHAVFQRDAHDRSLVMSSDRIVARASNPSGFSICVRKDHARWFLALDGWYEDFASAEEVLPLVRDSLTGNLRLKVEALGGKPWRWTGECLLPTGTWHAVFSGGYVRLRVGQKITCRYLRNRSKADADALAALAPQEQAGQSRRA